MVRPFFGLHLYLVEKCFRALRSNERPHFSFLSSLIFGRKIAKIPGARGLAWCKSDSASDAQGPREPRVGPGTAQISRISGFVQSKAGKENGTLFSGFSSDFRKKKVSTGIETVFLSKFRWSPKKKGLRCFIFISHGPLQAHGPPKIHGPRGHCPPCPPSRRPCRCCYYLEIFEHRFNAYFEGCC